MPSRADSPAGPFKIMYLSYIDDFTIQIIEFIYTAVLIFGFMYLSAQLFSYFLREIFGFTKKKKNDKD